MSGRKTKEEAASEAAAEWRAVTASRLVESDLVVRLAHLILLRKVDPQLKPMRPAFNASRLTQQKQSRAAEGRRGEMSKAANGND